MPDMIQHLEMKPHFSRTESTDSSQQPTATPQKLGKIARKTVHYLSLMVAEHPVEKHRQFQQQLQQHRRHSQHRTSSNQADVEVGAEWSQSNLSATTQGYQLEESEALVTSNRVEFESVYRSGSSWLEGSNVLATKRDQWWSSDQFLVSQTYSDFAEAEIPLARLRWLVRCLDRCSLVNDIHPAVAEAVACLTAHFFVADVSRYLQNAIQTIISSRELVHYANIMANSALPGDDRFYAVVQLECMLIGYSSPCKRRVVNVLTNTAMRKRMSHVEKLKLEIIITGEWMLEL